MSIPINHWYGNNPIGWGNSYSVSYWGSTNESNSWGIIYPFRASGSNITVDTNLIKADNTSIKVDQTLI